MVRAPKTQTIAAIDAAASLVLAASALWFLHLSRVSIEETIRKYGRNVDSGGFEEIIATLYLTPSAFLFGLAAVTMWLNWPLRRYVQGAAVIWLALPVVLVLVAAVIRFR